MGRCFSIDARTKEIQDRASVLPVVSESSWHIEAESGSNPKPDGEQPSAARLPADQPAVQKQQHILIVEDSKADVFLIRESVQSLDLRAELNVVQDGEKAIKFFEYVDRDLSAPCPDLIILDINLPKRSGGEVVRQMRQTRRCANVPILVVTSSDSERDRDEMAKLGVQAYFRKPSEYASFMKLGDLVKRLLEGQAHGCA